MADVGETTPIEASPIVERRPREPRDQGHHSPGQDHSHDHAPRNIDDVVFIMGVPPAEVTPAVHQALTHIMAEFDRIRLERDRLREQNHHLHELADHHGFLPVLNRRALLRELTRFLARAEQAEASGAFLYVDLPGLPALRARHGQAAADAALLRAAEAIRQHTRASDVVGSMDAGDFGVVLTLIDPATADAKVRDIADAIVQRTGEDSGGATALRPRCGLHVFNPGEEARDIVQAADRAARGTASAPAPSVPAPTVPATTVPD